MTNHQTVLEIEEAAIRRWAALALGRLDRQVCEISIQIVDDATIRKVNRRYLNHDWPTDVVTFPSEEPGGPVIAGELIISAETASRVAAELNTDPAAELALYLVHGLLHLAGWNDQSDQERREMRRWEARLLEALGGPHPSGDNLADRPPLAQASGTASEEARS